MALEIISLVWRPALEIFILAVGIYYAANFIRGTRGAPVVTGLVVLFVALSFLTTVLELTVLRWLLTTFSAFSAVAVLVIFQPELRRLLAELGNQSLLMSAREQREDVEVIIETVERLADVDSRDVGNGMKSTDVTMTSNPSTKLIGEFDNIQNLVLGAGNDTVTLTGGGGSVAVGAFAGSYIAGLLMVLAPGGLGVRESVLVFMLQGRIGQEPALALAAAHRLQVHTRLALVGQPLIDDTGNRLALEQPQQPVHLDPGRGDFDVARQGRIDGE